MTSHRSGSRSNVLENDLVESPACQMKNKSYVKETFLHFIKNFFVLAEFSCKKNPRLTVLSDLSKCLTKVTTEIEEHGLDLN